MIKVGITGQNGFVGRHLKNTLKLNEEQFELIPFDRVFFECSEKMQDFVSKCDVIVHLAGLNRHENPEFIYSTNVDLVKKLIEALEASQSSAHVIFSSSSQEEKNNLYGASKKEGRKLLEEWAVNNKGTFTGMIIPNVFGPFGKPFYNSVVATFCHQLANDLSPKIENDATLHLIYVSELIDNIVEDILTRTSNFEKRIPYTSVIKVSELLSLLQMFKEEYQERGKIPVLKSVFETHMFNTYRSYINIKTHYPVKYEQHVDARGSFVEIARLGIGGQVSFSTTKPGITRGNHYHTRKIERFSVIKGEALIQLRQIGSDEVLEFYLNGDEPAYVDMPIWYTHNIKNIGKETLYTNFWINEPYNPKDPDTYFETV